MKIPVDENRVQQQPQGSVTPPNVASAPPAAFGTGVYEADKGLGNTITAAGTALGEHIIERQRMQQQAQVIQADNEFRVGLQKSMFDTDPDPKTGIPKGVFNRQGLNAEGATQEFDQSFKAQRQAQIDAQDTPYKKQRLAELMDENYPRLRELVAKHEGTQVRQGQTSIVIGHNNLAMQNAPQYVGDANGLIKSVETEQGLLHSNLMSNGVAEDKISAQVNDLAGKIVTSSMRSLLNENPDGAQKFFDQITEHKDNPLSLKDQDTIQKIIDDAQKRHKDHHQQAVDIHTNGVEAEVGSKLANGELTQLELESRKDEMTPTSYNLYSKALQNKPGTLVTDETQQNKNFASLMMRYANINTSVAEDKRTAEMMKFRRDVVAAQTKLSDKGFQQLLGWTDPNFVAKQIPEKVSMWSSALKFINEHIDKYTDGKGLVGAVSEVMSKSANAAPEDIPAIAQQAAKKATLQNHSALIGQPDVSNNIVDQKKGIQQVYGQETTLKSAVKVDHPVKPPYGTTTIRGGKAYEWSNVDNKYHLKAK